MIFDILSIVLLIFGFGFVIFFHELGHFLAAKWAGVRVDQFAVGFGQAILCWRKGLGVRVGTTRPEYERRAREHLKTLETDTEKRAALNNAISEEDKLDIAAEDLGLGETEYRLNWMPLGGYVKMMGQDDLRPNSAVEHPKAYNTKPIGHRMVIVSAGVVMNVILAALLFMGLFLWGFNTPAAVVGTVLPGSPAQEAGLRTGDRKLEMEGRTLHDFAKATLNTALSREGVPVPLVVQRRDGTRETVMITPRRIPGGLDFPSLGIGRPIELRGAEERVYPIPQEDRLAELFFPETLAVGPGDVITQVNGEPVSLTQYYKLDDAIQESRGEPVVLRIEGNDGVVREIDLRPRLSPRYWGERMSFAGMLPRPAIPAITARSPARGKLMPGDVVVRLVATGTGDELEHPTEEELVSWLDQAGQAGQPLDLEILRDGQPLLISGITPIAVQTRPVERFGLGVQFPLGYDTEPVVANTVPGSSAAEARIPRGSRITHVNDQPVANWFQVHRAMAEVPGGGRVNLRAVAPGADGGQATEYAFTLRAAEATVLDNYRYGHPLFVVDGLVSVLGDLHEPRKTSNPLIAAWWGVTETRDFILQFYLTLQRMVTGQLSPRNVMGPVGIVQAGTHFAWQGTDWLIWFLAIISANLAVVNFLPIPVVDGGLFVFLILEKIKGKPLSVRTQTIAQFVGLAIILSVFILVTYQDIMRLIS